MKFSESWQNSGSARKAALKAFERMKNSAALYLKEKSRYEPATDLAAQFHLKFKIMSYTKS